MYYEIDMVGDTIGDRRPMDSYIQFVGAR